MKPMARNTLLMWAAIGVGACGGGGGNDNGGGTAPAPGPTADVSPGGIFFGSITGCTTVCPLNNVVLLVSESGSWMTVDPDFRGGVSIGQMTVDGSMFDSTRKYYTGIRTVFGYRPTSPGQIDSPNDSRAFDGTITERSGIEGTFSHSNSSNVSVDVDYDSQYDEDSGMQILSGTYSQSDTAGFTVTYIVDDNGVISGSDSSSCTANGQAETDFPNFNLYRITLEFSGCGIDGAQGTYTGMATLLDWPNNESLFFYALDEDETELVFLSLPIM